MGITFPSDTVTVIDEIRNAIGRSVTFVTLSGRIACPTCGVNPITNEGLDPFCVTCSGTGYVDVYEYKSIYAHVTWNFNDLPRWITGGTYVEGDCIIQIKFTEDTLTMLDKTSKVIVDGFPMIIKKRILRGIPEINRVILSLKQED